MWSRSRNPERSAGHGRLATSPWPRSPTRLDRRSSDTTPATGASPRRPAVLMPGKERQPPRRGRPRPQTFRGRGRTARFAHRRNCPTRSRSSTSVCGPDVAPCEPPHRSRQSVGRSFDQLARQLLRQQGLTGRPTNATWTGHTRRTTKSGLTSAAAPGSVMSPGSLVNTIAP